MYGAKIIRSTTSPLFRPFDAFVGQNGASMEPAMVGWPTILPRLKPFLRIASAITVLRRFGPNDLFAFLHAETHTARQPVGRSR